MFPIGDSLLSDLNPDYEARINEMVSQLKVTTPALVYRPVDPSMARSASQLGGFPCTDLPEWPHDKNGNPMVFVAQINFENSNSVFQIQNRSVPSSPSAQAPLTLSPKTGVLMLFLSADYTKQRAKDHSWYRIIYEANPSATPWDGLEGRPLPVAQLVPELIDHLISADCLETVPWIESLEAGDRDKTLTMFRKACTDQRVDIDERLKDAHQICCSDEQAREACIVAAFYANGISFDQARKADGHYKHLVDYAVEWEVLWKLAGLERVLPGEKRQLFICILRQNLLEFDFSKCVAVFL